MQDFFLMVLDFGELEFRLQSLIIGLQTQNNPPLSPICFSSHVGMGEYMVPLGIHVFDYDYNLGST